MNANDYVTVTCNKCGREYGFFPMRVVKLFGCECGNTNYGLAHKDWENDKFGDFTLVKKEEWILPSIYDLVRKRALKGD